METNIRSKVLIGKIGAWTSASGDSVLGKRHFPFDRKFQSLTDRAGRKYVHVKKRRFGNSVINVDTHVLSGFTFPKQPITTKKQLPMVLNNTFFNWFRKRTTGAGKIETGYSLLKEKRYPDLRDFQPLTNRLLSMSAPREISRHRSRCFELKIYVDNIRLKMTTKKENNIVTIKPNINRGVRIRKTGAKKSGTGNTLLGRKIFSIYRNYQRLTNQADFHYITDTPKVYDDPYMELNTTNENKTVTMEPDIHRIVLIGKTGVGKSALGNILLGDKLFSVSGSFQPLSNRAESKSVLAENSPFGRQILVVDTPGIFDTRFSSDLVANEIRKCIHLTTPGPHALILVVKASRLTKEDVEVFETYTDMFGESMLRYTVVVFTHFDHWKQIEGKTRDEAIEDFSKSFPETVSHFLKGIKNRYIMLDTKGTDVEDETKALFIAIKQMITDNKNGFYSYQHFIGSNKSKLRAKGLGSNENRRQKQNKNKRQLTSSFFQKNIKKARSSFDRETNASMITHS